MLTIEELDAFQQIKLDEVDIDTLVDLNRDTSLPCEKRMRKILDEGVNPYLFRVGDMKIKVSYSSTGRTLSDIIENLIEKAEC